MGLAILLADVCPGALPQPGERWSRAESGHFTLLCQSGERTSRRVALEVESLRALVLRLVDRDEVPDPAPTWVYAFRSPALLDHYRTLVEDPSSGTASFFVRHRLGNHGGLGLQGGSDRAGLHAGIAEDLVRRTLPRAPVWLRLGLAELVGSVKFEGSSLQIGRPPPQHLEWLRENSLLPTREFLERDQEWQRRQTRPSDPAFVAQSWALVHYLVLGSPTREQELDRYLEAAGREGETTVRLHLDEGALEAELAGYLGRDRLPRERYTLDELAPLQSDITVRPAPYPEVLSRLGYLLAAASQPRVRSAAEHFRTALREGGELSLAYTGLGLLKDLEGKTDEAWLFYQKGLEIDPDDHLLQYLRGRHLLEAVSRSPTGDRAAELLRASRQSFERSLALRPAFAEAYVALGATYLLDARASRAGLDALEAAWSLVPDRLDVALNLAVLRARLGDTRGARRLIETVLAPHAHPEQVARARRAVLEAELSRAEALVRTGAVSQGVALFQQMLAETRDAELRARLQRRLEEVEAVLEPP